ncbi:MAG: peptidase, partial [Pseudomonadota bacterium]
MTYCLGILIQEGLIMVSDSRTNAGIDQIATVRKQANFLDPDGRLITVLSAGNLGTTQSVVTTLKQSWGTGTDQDLKSVPTMFDATTLIAMVYRRILERDGDYVR